MRGLDALVFTGGIGQNAAALRQRVLEGAAWLGFEVSVPANQRGLGCITTADSAAAAWVMATSEEAVIAAQTLQCT